jgi:BON domain-containing protein
MSSRKQTHPQITLLNPPDAAGRQKQRELAGLHPLADQSAYLDRSEVDAAEPPNATERYEGEPATGGQAIDLAALPDGDNLQLLADLAAGVQPASVQGELSEIGNLELLTDIYERQLPVSIEDELVSETERLDLLTGLELRAGETADPLVASDEGATYVPPIDPPVVPGRAGSRANAEIASGLGISALDEPYDEAHHSSFLPADDEITARVREALRADSSTTQYADTIRIETRDGIVILRGMVYDLIDNDNLLAVASDVTGVGEVVDRLRVHILEIGV